MSIPIQAFLFHFFLSKLVGEMLCRYILKPIILHAHLWLFYPTAYKKKNTQKTASSKGVTNVLQRKVEAFVKILLALVRANLV